jgi:hypothetical protein
MTGWLVTRVAAWGIVLIFFAVLLETLDLLRFGVGEDCIVIAGWFITFLREGAFQPNLGFGH